MSDICELLMSYRVEGAGVLVKNIFQKEEFTSQHFIIKPTQCANILVRRKFEDFA